jgi:SAM-dependent methyltransferase
MESSERKSLPGEAPDLEHEGTKGQLSDRDRWNKKYLGSDGMATPDDTDEFLLRAFWQYVLPLFPQAGSALDLAGGAGRNAIWLAKQGWEVTLIDISDVGIERARQKAGPLGSHMRFVVDDLTHYKAAQIGFDLVIVFFFLERNIFAEILKSLRPGGLLIYKTRTDQIESTAGSPTINPAYLLKPGELLRLANGLTVLHHREDCEGEATAELVARKER